MKEFRFIIPYDFPFSREDREELMTYLRSLTPRIGAWGEEGRDVGLGFEWLTKRKNRNSRLTLTRKNLIRCLVQTRIISIDTVKEGIYNLEQRIRRTYGGTPGATIILRED